MAKKQRGRPPTKKMPERIDASPEDIARVVLRSPAPEHWRYLEESGMLAARKQNEEEDGKDTDDE